MSVCWGAVFCGSSCLCSYGCWNSLPLVTGCFYIVVFSFLTLYNQPNTDTDAEREPTEQQTDCNSNLYKSSFIHRTDVKRLDKKKKETNINNINIKTVSFVTRLYFYGKFQHIFHISRGCYLTVFSCYLLADSCFVWIHSSKLHSKVNTIGCWTFLDGPDDLSPLCLCFFQCGGVRSSESEEQKCRRSGRWTVDQVLEHTFGARWAGWRVVESGYVRVYWAAWEMCLGGSYWCRVWK